VGPGDRERRAGMKKPPNLPSPTAGALRFYKVQNKRLKLKVFHLHSTICISRIHLRCTEP